MGMYRVKVGFWVRAYDSIEIEADTDTQAVETAKLQALIAMESGGQPEYVEIESRHEGIICWIDRIGVPIERCTVAEDVEFDDDRIHAVHSCPVGAAA